MVLEYHIIALTQMTYFLVYTTNPNVWSEWLRMYRVNIVESSTGVGTLLIWSWGCNQRKSASSDQFMKNQMDEIIM